MADHQRQLAIVVAVDANNGIGKDGGLPWHLPPDLKHFKEVTTGQGKGAPGNGPSAVIMGRKTWESIPESFRPLPGRRNLVLTRQDNFSLPPEVQRSSSFEESLNILKDEKISRVFVIGGARVFKEALAHPECRMIYLTEIRQTFHCDTVFPVVQSSFVEQQSSNWMEYKGIHFRFKQLIRQQ